MKFVLAILAVIVLALTAQAQDVKTLIELLKDKDEVVRLKAAKQLGKLKEKAKNALPALVVSANQDEDEDVRTVARKSINIIKDAVAAVDKNRLRDVLDPLVKILKGKNLEKRIAALDKLSEFGTQAKGVGAEVVEFGLLVPALRDAATATLEKIDPQAHPLIITVLFDEKRENKTSAIERLAAMGKNGKSSLPALKYYYIHKITGGTTSETNVALSSMVAIAPGDKEVINAVLAIVVKPLASRRSRSGSPDRSLAIALLPLIKTTKKIKVAALKDALADLACRAQAVTQLGNMGIDAKEALPLLKKLRLDGDKQVREAVAVAIDKIKE